MSHFKIKIRVMKLAVILGLLLPLTACKESGPNPSTPESGSGETPLPQESLSFPQEGLQSFDMQVDGWSRHALVYAPQIENLTEKIPVVFVLHGGGGNAEKARENTNDSFEVLAEKQKFLVVYPQAILEKDDEGGHWNDGRDVAGYISHDLKVNDVSYLKTLLKNLASVYSGIDYQQAYFSGGSNGAMMTQRMACENKGEFKGFASVAGALPKNLVADCNPLWLAPMIFINGTADPLMRYNDEFVYLPNGDPALGERLTVPDTMLFWTEKLHCDNSLRQSTALPDLDKNDDSTVTQIEYECPSQNPVQLLRINGGGHTWPGGIGLPILTGPVNQDIDSAETIWNFFNGLE